MRQILQIVKPEYFRTLMLGVKLPKLSLTVTIYYIQRIKEGIFSFVINLKEYYIATVIHIHVS